MKINMKSVGAALDILPGGKRYVTAMVAVGMLYCQSRGYHAFTMEDWAAVGIMGGVFWKMSMDRKPVPDVKWTR